MIAVSGPEVFGPGGRPPERPKRGRSGAILAMALMVAGCQGVAEVPPTPIELRPQPMSIDHPIWRDFEAERRHIEARRSETRSTYTAEDQAYCVQCADIDLETLPDLGASFGALRCASNCNALDSTWLDAWERRARRLVRECAHIESAIDKEVRSTALLALGDLFDAKAARCLRTMDPETRLDVATYLAPTVPWAAKALQRERGSVAAWARTRLQRWAGAPSVSYGRAQALWRTLDETPGAHEALAPLLCTLAQSRFAGQDQRELLKDPARARVGAECDAPFPPPIYPPDYGCPPTLVPLQSVSEPTSTSWVELWPWAWQEGDRLEVFEGQASPPVDRGAFPEVRVAAPGSFDPVVRREAEVLPRDADALLRLSHGWIAGVSNGEFGGGLWWIPQGGAPRFLLSGNFGTLLEWQGHHLAVDAVGRMGTGIGALIEIVERERDVDVRLFAELPTDPWSIQDRGATLVATSDRGILEIDRDRRVVVHRCAGGDPDFVDRPFFVRRRDLPSDARPNPQDVRDCFALTPNCTFRETPDEDTHTLELLFTTRDDARWAGRRKPTPESLAPPGVAECLLRASDRWKHPPTAVGAYVAEFHYACGLI